MTKKGDRVRLVRTDDPWTNLRPGAVGTVVYIDGPGTIHVKWDDGHELGLIPEVDKWEVLDV